MWKNCRNYENYENIPEIMITFRNYDEILQFMNNYEIMMSGNPAVDNEINS